MPKGIVHCFCEKPRVPPGGGGNAGQEDTDGDGVADVIDNASGAVGEHYEGGIIVYKYVDTVLIIAPENLGTPSNWNAVITMISGEAYPWRLPTVDELQRANDANLLDDAPSFHNYYWTSDYTMSPTKPPMRYDYIWRNDGSAALVKRGSEITEGGQWQGQVLDRSARVRTFKVVSYTSTA